eukprot:9472381-Pyramimonas_sp.AAC.2
MVAVESLLGDRNVDDWPKPQHSLLKDVHYVHGLFPKEFLEAGVERLCPTLGIAIQMLESERWEHPVSTCSNNMYAHRHFLRSPKIAAQLLSYIPQQYKVSRIPSTLGKVNYGGSTTPPPVGAGCSAHDYPGAMAQL